VQVGYGEAELGVSFIGYTIERLAIDKNGVSNLLVTKLKLAHPYIFTSSSCKPLITQT